MTNYPISTGNPNPLLPNTNTTPIYEYIQYIPIPVQDFMTRELDLENITGRRCVTSRQRHTSGPLRPKGGLGAPLARSRATIVIWGLQEFVQLVAGDEW